MSNKVPEYSKIEEFTIEGITVTRPKFPEKVEQYKLFEELNINDNLTLYSVKIDQKNPWIQGTRQDRKGESGVFKMLHNLYVIVLKGINRGVLKDKMGLIGATGERNDYLDKTIDRKITTVPKEILLGKANGEVMKPHEKLEPYFQEDSLKDDNKKNEQALRLLWTFSTADNLVLIKDNTIEGGGGLVGYCLSGYSEKIEELNPTRPAFGILSIGAHGPYRGLTGCLIGASIDALMPLPDEPPKIVYAEVTYQLYARENRIPDYTHLLYSYVNNKFRVAMIPEEDLKKQTGIDSKQTEESITFNEYLRTQGWASTKYKAVVPAELGYKYADLLILKLSDYTNNRDKYWNLSEIKLRTVSRVKTEAKTEEKKKDDKYKLEGDIKLNEEFTEVLFTIARIAINPDSNVLPAFDALVPWYNENPTIFNEEFKGILDSINNSAAKESEARKHRDFLSQGSLLKSKTNKLFIRISNAVFFMAAYDAANAAYEEMRVNPSVDLLDTINYHFNNLTVQLKLIQNKEGKDAYVPKKHEKELKDMINLLLAC